MGSTVDRLMRVKQVHGNVIRVLKRGQVPEGGAYAASDGDAIVSNEAGLVLAVVVADCVPILVCDPVRGAAAAIHAGWRGTCARVGEAPSRRCIGSSGGEPADLVAAIGPSVGPGDYQVGDSLITSFREAGHPQARVDRWFMRRGDKLFLDLWAANTDQLIDAGLAAKHIHLCALSTVSRPDIFDSFRVEGEKAGRMAGIIVVPSST